MSGVQLENRRILVVEDDMFLAEDISLALQDAAAHVVGPVATIAAANAALTSGDPIHAAILDINLQGETVYPFAGDLAARDIPFVFATGHDSESIPAQFSHVPRWEQPYDSEALLRQLGGLALD